MKKILFTMLMTLCLFFLWPGVSQNKEAPLFEKEQWVYYSYQNNLNHPIVQIFIISLLSLGGVILLFMLNRRYLKNEVARQVERLNWQKEEDVMLKNEFLSSVSHELRSPMNIITSLIYLLSQSNLDKNQRDKITKINKASHLLLTIINNFLDFNRLEKGLITLERQPFSLKGEVNDMVSLFHDDVKDKGLYLECHFDSHIPQILWGDSLRLNQILTNLLGNAVKFSIRGTISVSVFVSELSKNNCRLNISIKDQGMGIEQEKLEKLFLPFTQADASIYRQFGGSGLGLAICYQLVHLMKGRITVTSQLDRGSEFTLSLPFEIARKKDWKEENIKEKFDSYKGARVLYVEDNPVNREIGLELMDLAQIRVTPAENGIDALEKMSKENFDLILMDIQMPIMDGLTTTVKIREKEKLNHSTRIPIVALTAQFLEEEINNAYHAGMDGHISKPISIGKLNREFEKWLTPYRTKIKDEKKIPHVEAFPPLPGVDMEDVMERFSGNYTLLIDSLDRFVDDYSLMSGLLLSLGNQHKETDLSQEIHSIKGVLGSLGMGVLYENAGNLEVMIMDKKDYTSNLREFCLDFDKQILSLKGRLANV